MHILSVFCWNVYTQNTDYTITIHPHSLHHIDSSRDTLSVSIVLSYTYLEHYASAELSKIQKNCNQDQTFSIGLNSWAKDKVCYFIQLTDLMCGSVSKINHLNWWKCVKLTYFFAKNTRT